MKKLWYSFFFTLFLSAQLSIAQTAQDLDLWLEKNSRHMGGRAVLLILKNDSLLYSGAVNKMGMKDKITARLIANAQKKPADFTDFNPETRLSVASSSKWLSAALVMTFVDEGKIKTGDTIGKYLPVLSGTGKGRITIAQCLSHLTAIKSPPLRQSLDEIMNAGSMDQVISDIARMPLEGEPGKVFQYSNVGLQLAAAVIEKVGGKDFETLFLERIAQPLEMYDTNFKNGKVVLPAGGANSSANDYLKFLNMILHYGEYKGKRILSRQSVEEMQVNRIGPDVKISYSPAESEGAGYGYGLWTMLEAVSSPGLFGSFPVVDHKRAYAAVLVTFYLGSQGKQKRYAELKALMDGFTSKVDFTFSN